MTSVATATATRKRQAEQCAMTAQPLARIDYALLVVGAADVVVLFLALLLG